MSRTRPKTDVDSLGRSCMQQAIKNANGLPEHFSVRNLPNKPKVRITDKRTGTSVDVGLCHSIGAFQAIAAFCS